MSVLDEMTKNIVGHKEAKASKLTPVGSEVGGPLAGLKVPGQAFPNDHPEDSVRDAIRLLEDVLTSLRGLIGQPAPATETAPSQTKEQLADETFRASMKAKSEAAQAQVFKAPEPEPEPTPEGYSDWTCPAHGVDGIVPMESRKGRKYWACSKCEEFEK